MFLITWKLASFIRFVFQHKKPEKMHKILSKFTSGRTKSIKKVSIQFPSRLFSIQVESS